MPAPEVDVVVVGAGFGGLGAAIGLAERGLSVRVFEAVDYPGGCASTFSRDGYRFEAGATLSSGLAEGQIFRRWLDRFDLPVEVEWLDPVAELRTPDFRLEAPSDRSRFLERLVALEPRHEAGIRSFFAEQKRVADALWPLFDDPELLPPLSLTAVGQHARRALTYRSVVPWLGRPLSAVLERHGLGEARHLRTVVDALCQITVQCSAAEAEAPFALSAMDYWFRGVGHVRGGIGALAHGLVEVVESLGGTVSLNHRVRGIEQTATGWAVHGRKRTVYCRSVVANVPPQSLGKLVTVPPGPNKRIARWSGDVRDGWGAVMAYLVCKEPPGTPRAAHHLQLVQDSSEPLQSGNHLFVSISSANDRGRCPPGHRTLTVSTHQPMAMLRGSQERAAEVVQATQDAMRVGLEALAPEWMEGVVHALPASPRTFQKWTRRGEGLVGGVPRRAGLHNYTREVWPRAVLPGLYLVGDSVFPGQSTLATAVGGVCVSRAVARALG